MRKSVTIFIAFLASMWFSISTHALAISDVELKSSLNQLLDARIYLLKATPEELSSLKISINPVNLAGDQRMVALQHEVVISDAGDRYILISSKDAIHEPILNFLIEVDWSGGRLIREYSLIIDPQ